MIKPILGSKTPLMPTYPIWEIKNSKERNLKNYGVALIIGYNSRAGIEKPKGNNY